MIDMLNFQTVENPIGDLATDKYYIVHSVAKVYAFFPFYDVKCLCSRGWE